MVAYSYQGRFEAPIRAGIKPQTMRNERKRHARPGEEIQHYFGMRTKHCRLIGRSTCTAVTPVRIDFRYRTIDIERRPIIKGAIALNLFAERDGFEDWDALCDFWEGTHGVKDDANGMPALPAAWAGVLIEWTDFKPAP
jgi:hypothetical protein